MYSTLKYIDLEYNLHTNKVVEIHDIRLNSFNIKGVPVRDMSYVKKGSSIDNSKQVSSKLLPDEISIQEKPTKLLSKSKIDNFILKNYPELLYQFQEKHGIEKLNHLITLSDEMATEEQSFNKDLRDILESNSTNDEALGKLEELMGLTSDTTDLV